MHLQHTVSLVRTNIFHVKGVTIINLARNFHTLLNHIFSHYECEICDYFKVEPFSIQDALYELDS